MLYSTRGIVFRYIKYKESSIIVNIFTEKLGLQSYIVNGVRSKKSKNKIALFQPLTLLDLIVYHKESANLNRISEIKCNHPYQTISIDIKKSSIVIFLTEILNKTVKEEGVQQNLFEFLHQSLLVLDHLEKDFQNFHLQFLLKLSRYLGFGAESSTNEITAFMPYEKVKEGNQIIRTFLKAQYDEHLKINNILRRDLLENIIKYYQRHMGLSDIKSLTILKEIIT